MPKKTSIKFYTHHFLHVDLKTGSSSGFGRRVFMFFYYIGLGVLKIGKKIQAGSKPLSKQLTEDANRTRQLFPKRLRLINNWTFLKTISVFLILVCSGFFGLRLLDVLAQALKLKNQILTSGLKGAEYLNQAKQDLTRQDFNSASNNFLLAYKNFSQGQSLLGSTNLLISQLTALLPPARSTDELLQAASLISSGGSQISNLLQNLQNARLTPQGLNLPPDEAQALFSRLNDSLGAVAKNLDQAGQAIASVDPSYLPASYRQDFLKIKTQFSEVQNAFQNFQDVIKLFTHALEGPKHILFLLENNNELRPTGGFIGSYADLDLNYGKIQKIQVSSIYDLDGQLQQKITPPAPILNVNDRWFLRDSNWFADFPASAQKITQFYEQEGGATPDLIIAMTPNFIIDLLKVFGPLALPKYGLTLTPENFVELTQVASSISYRQSDPYENKPKQILADLLPILMQKISKADHQQSLAILQSLENNLQGKQILIYFRDAQTQNFLEKFHWAGKVADTDRDYLSVVSSNLGGTKTDLYVDQTLSLNSIVQPNGEIIDQLQITRKNTMPQMDGTQNTGFLRVLVPLGSTLISNSGFDKKTLQPENNQGYQTDPDVYAWEKNSVSDVVSGTTIGQESGKTYFGNWLTVQGGESKTVTLVYKLPFKLSATDHQSLLLQKQAGSLDQNFSYQLDFPGKKAQWINFQPQTLREQSLKTTQLLNQDLFFGEVFSNKQ